MQPSLRQRHLSLLEQLVGRTFTRFIGTGSRSMLRLEPSGALVLMSSGTLDREGRLACHIRTRDAEVLLERQDAAVSCYWTGLDAPLVIPASVFEAPIRLLTPSSANQYAVKIRARGPGITLVPTETRVDRWLGGGYLRVLRDMTGESVGVPRLTHHQWQTLVAALEHVRGCDVAVPPNDRTRLDASIIEAVGLPRLDLMPVALHGSRARDVDVVATPRGGDLPARLIEVEHRADVRAALHRGAQVLAHLAPLVGPDDLPEIVIVADERRRARFARYVGEAPLPQLGVTERCTFKAYDEVYAEALRLLPLLPPHLRAA